MFLVLPYPLKRVSLQVEHRWLAKYIHQFEIHQLLERGHLPWTGINISDISCRCHLRMQLLLGSVETVFEKKIKSTYSERCSEENKCTLSEDSEVQIRLQLLKKYCRHTVSKSLNSLVTFTMKRAKLSFGCASESVRYCHSDHSVLGNSH